ncbi:MAG: asparagine synthase-related protein, partial [Qipengyuania vulgaris]
MPQQRTAVGRAIADEAGTTPFPVSIGEFEIWGPGDGAKSRVFGRIDNAAEIRTVLGLAANASLAELYDASLRRWGPDTDTELVGHYCVITVEGPGRLRLVRSPWTAPPLHFFTSRELVAASPLLGALFAAGAPSNIDWTYLADQLAFDHHDCEPVGWYEGIGRVPLGSRVIIDAADWKLERYYDPLAVEPVELASDEAYVERGLELLDEAAGACVAGLKKPAIMLSGGLDSPLAALAVLKHLPGGQHLPSFTFGPHPDWDGWEPDSGFGEERKMVRRFAAMHQRIEPHFPEERGGHDYALREVLARTEVPTANIANTGIFHPLFEAAKAQGCDSMLTALHGNFTFSL